MHNPALGDPSVFSCAFVTFLSSLLHLQLHHGAPPVALVSPNNVGAGEKNPPPFPSRARQQVLVLALHHNHRIRDRQPSLEKSFPKTSISRHLIDNHPPLGPACFLQECNEGLLVGFPKSLVSKEKTTWTIITENHLKPSSGRLLIATQLERQLHAVRKDIVEVLHASLNGIPLKTI